MSAMVVIDTRTVWDEVGLQHYVDSVPLTVLAYGGTYRVVDIAPSVLEGEWQHGQIVVIEFDTTALALAWYNSELYRPLRELRKRISNGSMILARCLDEAVYF